MSDMNKCFEILNIPPGAPYEEAKAAYRELASILHPDKHMNNDRLRVRATEKFKQLQNAWSELEAHYKNPGLNEQAHYEKHQRENQQSERAEAERRADAKHRADAERKRHEQLQYNQHKCPCCGDINTVGRGKSIESLKCRCGYFWSKDTETQLKRKTKFKFARLIVIYVLFYIGLLKVIGGFGILIMIFSAPCLLLFTFIWHVGFDGWRTS
jgi:curved DNA-binding protein CbpA